jgi:hypothetical protein
MLSTGEDLRFDLEIDFKTAVFGGERSIRVNHLEVRAVQAGRALARVIPRVSLSRLLQPPASPLPPRFQR